MFPLLLNLLVLLSSFACESVDLSCGAASSCEGRCYETQGIHDIRGEEAPLAHLRCRCDHVCFMYGDCCADFTEACPPPWGYRWMYRKYRSEQKYVTCQKLKLEDKYPESLAVISKCPQDSDPFSKYPCESAPDFYDLHSFVPVTSSDGRVYRNKYCAKCLRSKAKVFPWEIIHVSCDAAMDFVFEAEDGFHRVGIDKASRSRFMSLVKKWLATHCHSGVAVRPHQDTSFHYCDDSNDQMPPNSVCEKEYDPVWVRGAGGLVDPLLFKNADCARKSGYGNETKRCVSQSHSSLFTFRSYDSQAQGDSSTKFFPGSLTILLNFGPDGKTNAKQVDKNSMGSLKPCPKGSILETATNTCKKLICPSGTKLLVDGSCQPVKEVDVVYETHVAFDISLSYDTAFFPRIITPRAVEFLKVQFTKYLRIDNDGMVKFNITGGLETGRGDDIHARCSIEMELNKDMSMEGFIVIRKMFNDFNKQVAAAGKQSKAFKIEKMNCQILGIPNENGNKTQEVEEIEWCPNGDLRFYNGSSEFEYWMVEVKTANGTVKNETLLKTFDTETVYKTGEFDLMIFLETDLMTDEEVLEQRALVCQRHPWIRHHDCKIRVMLHSSEFRYLKNRSIEVFSDHEIYEINEYEKCPRVVALIPAKSIPAKSIPVPFRNHDPKSVEAYVELLPSMRLRVDAHKDTVQHFSDKIMVCLHDRAKGKETMFFTFSSLQGMITVILLPISIVSLLATMSIYIFFRKLRNLPGLILLHLAFALLLSQSLLLFMLNYDVGVSWRCTILAVVNHYLLLMSFSWMNSYAYMIYGTFANLTNSISALKNFSVMRKLRNYCFYAYGAPAFFISICIAIDCATGFIHYGGDSLIYKIRDIGDGNGTYYGNACWINNPLASVSFFGVPVLVMVIVNLILYVLTVRHMKAGSKNMTTGRRSSNLSLNAEPPVDLKTFMRLSTVMGFTWILGYSSAFVKSIAVSAFGNELQEIISFFFIFFTALQGVGILVAFATGKRVKAELKEVCGRYGLDEESRRFSQASVTTVSSLASTPEVKERKLF